MRRRPLPPRSADCGPPTVGHLSGLGELGARHSRRPARSQRCPTFAVSRRLAAPRYPCAAAAQMARSRHRASRGTSRGGSPRPSQPPRAARGRLSTRCCGRLGAGKFGSRCRDDGCSDGLAQALTSRGYLPPEANPTSVDLAGQTQASVSFFQATCSVSGKTRVPAMDVMKLVSPDQRGSTCRWR